MKINIYPESFNCEKCGASIYSLKNKVEKCSCGATYEISVFEKDAHFECDSKLKGFCCVEYNCENICPTSNMYCKDHSNSESLDKAENCIKYNEDSLQRAKDNYEKMNESRKIWVVSELSGLKNDETL